MPSDTIRIAILATSIVLLSLAGLPAALAQDSVVVFRGGTVIDVTGGPPIENAVVIIRGNRIEAVGAGLRTPAGAAVVEATGKYILPGLWDKHLHYKDWMPEFLITNGVTSAFVQGGQSWLNAQREGIAKGKIPGPRFFMRQISINETRDAARARQQVGEAIRLGADFIKVYTSITPEMLAVVTDEAHRRGLVVEGHLGIRASQAIQAGIDGLTHATGIALDIVTQDVIDRIPQMRVVDEGRLRVNFPRIKTWDESRDDFDTRDDGNSPGGPNPDLTEYWLFIEDPRRIQLFGMMDRGLAQNLIDQMVREQIYIESCLTYVFRAVHDRMEEYRLEDHLLLSDPNLHYLPDHAKTNVLNYEQLKKLTPEELALMKEGYRNMQWFFKTFIEQGGRLIIGPDTTSINHATMLPGVATRRELQLLVDAGVPPIRAIQAATIWPAQTLGKDKDLGSVEAGKLADLIMLSRNPLEDITAFKDIEIVMQDGRFLETGYHYDFVNPIPWPPQNQLGTADLGIPTRIQSISPQAVPEGNEAVELNVRGRGFISTSVIRFDGRLLRTELIDSTHLRAQIPENMLRAVGSFPVQVENIPPEWGTSNTRYLIVKFK